MSEEPLRIEEILLPAEKLDGPVDWTQLFDNDNTPALTLVKPGMAEGPFQIDAISGATMTSDKVQDLITAAAENFIRIREKENR